MIYVDKFMIVLGQDSCLYVYCLSHLVFVDGDDDSDDFCLIPNTFQFSF